MSKGYRHRRARARCQRRAASRNKVLKETGAAHGRAQPSTENLHMVPERRATHLLSVKQTFTQQARDTPLTTP
jgi:hypothetical protein